MSWCTSSTAREGRSRSPDSPFAADSAPRGRVYTRVLFDLNDGARFRARPGLLPGVPRRLPTRGDGSPSPRWPGFGPRTGPCPGLAKRAAQRPTGPGRGPARRPRRRALRAALRPFVPVILVVLVPMRGAGRAREGRGHRPVTRLHCPRRRRAQCRLARRPLHRSRPAWPGRGRRERPAPVRGPSPPYDAFGAAPTRCAAGPLRGPGGRSGRSLAAAPRGTQLIRVRPSRAAWPASGRGAAWPEGRPRPQGRDAPGIHGA